MEELDKLKETIAVWFSCGAASAVAAFLTVEKYSDTHNILIFNNPVIEEDEDNIRFKSDVEKWLGVKVIDAKNKDYPNASANEVWEKRRYMSGVAGAPCTLLLKKGARYQAELDYKIDWHVLGFTIDEKGRHERFTTFERKNVIPVLIDEGLTKADCFKIIENNGIELPRIYKILDNANCIGCVKSGGVDYWQRIRKHFPDVFEKRATLSRELNCRLVRYNGKRIFLDELPENATGRKSRRVECGIFCELPKFKKRKFDPAN
jgi:hypothetical protein